MPCPEKFSESLVKFEVKQDIIDEIQTGYENITTKTKKRDKAAYFKRAMDIMDEKLDSEQVQEIMEWNACCKTGAREKASKEFARINAKLPLADKLAKISKAPYMSMGSPELTKDGLIKLHAVYYMSEGKFACACSNYNRLKRDYPVSKSYCYCCGGHFKYHYEIMLGVKLKMVEIDSSPLNSDGGDPCIFVFKIMED